MSTNVLVIIGAGGIGLAIARRQGSGKAVLLADVSESILANAAQEMTTMGYAVTTQRVDVSSRESVHALVGAATNLGSVVQVVHTAGLSPNMAPPDKILAVDLLGTALVLDEFGRVIADGAAAAAA